MGGWLWFVGNKFFYFSINVYFGNMIINRFSEHVVRYIKEPRSNVENRFGPKINR